MAAAPSARRRRRSPRRTWCVPAIPQPATACASRWTHPLHGMPCAHPSFPMAVPPPKMALGLAAHFASSPAGKGDLVQWVKKSNCSSKILAFDIEPKSATPSCRAAREFAGIHLGQRRPSRLDRCVRPASLRRAAWWRVFPHHPSRHTHNSPNIRLGVLRARMVQQCTQAKRCRSSDTAGWCGGCTERSVL